MATYFDPASDAALLNPDVRSHSELQAFVDKAERQILAFYSIDEPGDCLDTERQTFAAAMKDAIAAQAHYLWQEPDFRVSAEGVAGQSKSYRGYARLCAEARDCLRPYDTSSRHGVPGLRTAPMYPEWLR